MGTGSGILAQTLSSDTHCSEVHACDINPTAIETFSKEANECCKAPIFVHHSDLFSWFESNDPSVRFDTIVFNPPYLPEQSGEDEETERIVSGGKKGHELTLRFIDGLKRFLSLRGNAFCIVSSLAQQNGIEKYLFENGFFFSVVAEESYFFEKVSVYRITHHPGLISLSEKRSIPLSTFSFLARGKKGIIYTFPSKNRTCAVKVYNFRHPNYPPEHSYLEHEGQILSFLNRYGIGPKLIDYTDDAVAYEFVEGSRIQKWLAQGISETQKTVLLTLILLKCYLLDLVGISKFELTNPHKHILVNDTRNKDNEEHMIGTDELLQTINALLSEPENVASAIEHIQHRSGLELTFIDFERARRQKKPKNLTQIIQYISYRDGRLLMSHTLSDADHDKTLAGYIKEYKQTYDHNHFLRIIHVLLGR
jgi:release factor glutamine methyltransferase